ncbi:MAG: ABC transporter permease [Tannerella sp.]|jgi:hypothetical protein|nr:ABC transporter permease [Tannerella sp.]
MLKSIFVQIMNRKRSNGWILAELLLVFILVWYVADWFFVLGCNYGIPNCRNIEHTWKITLGKYPEDHPKYDASTASGQAAGAGMERILRELNGHPDVEAVAVSFFGSDPEVDSYSGGIFYSEGDTVNSVRCQDLYIDPKEDFFRVFGYTADGGTRAVSTRDFDWSAPRSVVIGRLMADRLFPDGQAVGKRLTRKPGDMSDPCTVAGVVDDIKQYDYERPQYALYNAYRLDSTAPDAAISIRSRASVPDRLFEESFKKEMTGRLQTGNFYLKSMTPYARIASDTWEGLGTGNAVRERAALMTFFLLNILLCVTGTFWYRIHIRREEIGIRKTMGASSRSIRSHLLTEGMLLLTVAMLPAMFIEFQFVLAGLIETFGKTDTHAVYLPDRTGLRFLITNAVTWAIMAAVIAVAISLPARRAAALPPAEALRYE